MDIIQDDERLQVVVNKIKAGISDEEFVNNHRLLRRGDIVSTSDPKHIAFYFSKTNYRREWQAVEEQKRRAVRSSR
jgi:predicted Zn-dependent peptidase